VQVLIRTARPFSFYVCGVVELYAVQERLTAPRMPDMLDTEVHTFLDIPISDNFVDDDTNGVCCNVVHNTGPSVTPPE
jgi:hypothetical protein